MYIYTISRHPILDSFRQSLPLIFYALRLQNVRTPIRAYFRPSTHLYTGGCKNDADILDLASSRETSRKNHSLSWLIQAMVCRNVVGFLLLVDSCHRHVQIGGIHCTVRPRQPGPRRPEAFFKDAHVPGLVPGQRE